MFMPNSISPIRLNAPVSLVRPAFGGSVNTTPRFGNEERDRALNHPIVKLTALGGVALVLALVMKAMTGSYVGIEIPKPEDMFNAPQGEPPALKAPQNPGKAAPAKDAPKAANNDKPPKVTLGPNLLPADD
jgi:hypothetical protein